MPLKALSSGFLLSNLQAMSGGGIIDDSLEVSDAIMNGNPNAVLLCLAPASHSNVRQEAVVQKRRQLEDRLLGSLVLKRV